MGRVCVEPNTSALQFDLTPELETAGRGSARVLCAAYDDLRGALFTGADDGSVHVWRVSRATTGARDLRIRIIKVAAPVIPAPAPGTTTAPSPVRLSALWYDTVTDVLYTGDVSGVVRVLEKVRLLRESAPHAYMCAP